MIIRNLTGRLVVLNVIWPLMGMGVFLFLASQNLARGSQTLTGHLPRGGRFGPSLGRLASTNQLSLAIGLPLRNPAELDQLIAQIYDPKSTNYHRYLTPAQFAERFGPSETDYNQVIAFARKQGLAVTQVHPNRVVLNVRGAVTDVERAFHLQLHRFQHDREKRTYFAPDRNPLVDLATPILQVGGLDSYALPKPMHVARDLTTGAAAVPKTGSGQNGTYMGNDFRGAYVPGVAETGAGQSVALLQYDGYVSNDIAAYEANAGLPAVSLVNVPVNGGVPVPGSGNTEVALDIEMVISMAPGISNIIVYEAPNGPTAWSTILSQIANDNLAHQVSCSWGNTSSGPPDLTSEQIFKQMAVQGQTFFNAVGDSDAFSGGIPFPSESTNIVQVGGTKLFTSNPSGNWSSESVWNRGNDTGTGGGISLNFILPDWQQGIDMTANGGSTTARNVPDVALVAESVLVVSDTNKFLTVGGTSCSAPLWAGLTALINQRAAANGNAPVGYLNPAIYNIGKSASYTNCFHDITTGNNFNSSSPALFPAVPGYDLCTGWGTPIGQNLIAVLSDPLGVLPLNGYASKGEVGGPFSLTSASFTVTNAGTEVLNWAVVNVPAWLTVVPSGGILATNGSTHVTVSLTGVAAVLPAGVYYGQLSFNNLASGVGQSRQITLQVGQSLVQNGGFETGSFSGWNLVGRGIIPYGFGGVLIYNAVEPVTKYADAVHSGLYGAFMGDSDLATISQNLATQPGRSYQLSFWLSNPANGSGQQFLVNWNTNSASTNQIYYTVNPPVFAWTNLTYVLTATGTNTILQFGAANPPNYFGLDDVSLTPIPAPSFASAGYGSNSIRLTWYTVAGLNYEVLSATNLVRQNWTILSTNTASDVTLSVTNSLGTDPQRFFRILRVP